MRRFPASRFSTDIIVGFHGEENQTSERRPRSCARSATTRAFMFKYSVREHTRASQTRRHGVSEEEKQRRLTGLIALQEEMSLARNRAMIGREFPVLVEGAHGAARGMLAGKTPQFKTAISPRRGNRAGDTVNVRVDSADRPFADVLDRVIDARVTTNRSR